MFSLNYGKTVLSAVLQRTDPFLAKCMTARKPRTCLGVRIPKFQAVFISGDNLTFPGTCHRLNLPAPLQLPVLRSVQFILRLSLQPTPQHVCSASAAFPLPFPLSARQRLTPRSSPPAPRRPRRARLCPRQPLSAASSSTASRRNPLSSGAAPLWRPQDSPLRLCQLHREFYGVSWIP